MLVVGASRLVVGTPRLGISAPGHVIGTPRLVIAIPRLVVDIPRCSPGCHQNSYGHLDLLPGLPGAPEGHSISPVYSRM
jgi:hypothetical protein